MPASERCRSWYLVVASKRLCWCRLRDGAGSRPHGAVLAWRQAVDNSNLQLASVSLGVIQAGIDITREQDAAKASAIEAWLDQLSESNIILPMDGRAFRCWAQLMHRRSDTLYEDAMIAALGIVGWAEAANKGKRGELRTCRLFLQKI